MSLILNFKTPEQEEFFNLNIRNSCFSGGFGNGKTYVGCQKILFLALTFPNSRAVIARYEESKLKQTTMVTFYKVCSPEFYNADDRVDSRNALTLKNGSKILFMNLKDTDDGMIRGLEVNFILIDQAEEISESMYLLLSSRAGRWDLADVPENLRLETELSSGKKWPMNPRTHTPKVPAYNMILCNPDSELHWIYRRFHPESEEYSKLRTITETGKTYKFSDTHKMIQGKTTTATIDEELYETYSQNDEAWVKRFRDGIWGIPGGAIHLVSPLCELEIGVNIQYDFLREIIKKGILFRVLDHGDAAPTCCLWFSSYKNWYICYREYYKPNALISEHRKNIAEYSASISDENGKLIEEKYSCSIADPAIFKMAQQKYGGKWCTADEYLDSRIDAPKIYFEPADNNEIATRNRISELLRGHNGISTPYGVQNSPRLLFIKRNELYPTGAYFSLKQLKAQKREKIGSVDGKDIFSDERDKNVEDHAYDCIRYYCASHARFPQFRKPLPGSGTFYDVRKQFLANKIYRKQIA